MVWRNSLAELCEPLESQREIIVEKPEVFTNSSRNRLTEYGNSLVLEYFRTLPPERRAKAILCDLPKTYEQGGGEFITEFRMLQEKMKIFRWSKEQVQEMFGVSLKDLRREYFRLTDAV